MQKKCILHLLNSSSYSGAENVVCQIIEAFKKDNIDMVYCSREGNIRTILEEKEIEYIAIKKVSIAELKRVISVIKPDIIHAHDFTASVIAAFSAQNIPVISHIHNNASWIKKVNLKTILYAFACTRAGDILTVSDSIFKEYVFGHWFYKKVQIVGNPISYEEIIQKAKEYRVEKKIDVLYCGRLSYEKNPELFIDIVADLKKKYPLINAAIIGTGNLSEHIEEKVNALNLSDNIIMYGFQKNPYPIMAASRTICIPSLWEGFGLVSVEAMALGVPVVCSGAGGLKDIVNEACGYICQEENEYAEAIDELLSNKEIYEKKSNSAQTRAKQLANKEKYKMMLASVYSKL